MSKPLNGLKCLKCGTFLDAPYEDRDYRQCKCSNRAWIQKRPDGNFWAYGSVNPILNERINEKATKASS